MDTKKINLFKKMTTPDFKISAVFALEKIMPKNLINPS
jgi:hypothetical protein